MAKDKTELVKAARVQTPMVMSNDSLYDDNMCKQINRVAAIFAASNIVPEHFRDNQANCFIVIHQAKRMNVDPMMAMQYTYVIKGKIGMEAKMAIALMNSRGPFTGPVQWDMKGEGPTRQATAYGTHKETGERCDAVVSMAMAEGEGWTKNPKWRTMTDLMLKYRSATFLARLYCPEVLMGMLSTEELRDMEASTPAPPLTEGRMGWGKKKQPQTEADTVALLESGADETTPDPIDVPVAEAQADVEAPESDDLPEEGFVPAIAMYVQNGPTGRAVRVIGVNPPMYLISDGRTQTPRAGWPAKLQEWEPKGNNFYADDDGVMHPTAFKELNEKQPEPTTEPAPEPAPADDPPAQEEKPEPAHTLTGPDVVPAKAAIPDAVPAPSEPDPIDDSGLDGEDPWL